MNSNKSILYINTECFGTDAQDQLRVELNKFWHDQVPAKRATQFEEAGFNNSTNIQYSGQNTRNPNGAPSLQSVQSDSEIVSDNVRPIKKQTIQIYAEEGYTDEEWKEYVLSTVLTNTVFTDLSHKINLPLTYAEQEGLNYGPYETVSVTPDYNFYIKEYEAKRFTTKVSENDLPSLYSYASYSEDEDSEGAKVATGNGRYNKDMVNLLNSDQTSRSYFKNFAKGTGQGGSVNEKSNVYLSTNTIQTMMEYNEKKFSFPMYSEILFTTDNRAQIASVISSANMSSEIVKGLSEGKTAEPLGFVVGESNFNIQDARVYNLLKWIEQFSANGPTPELPNSYFLGKPNTDTKTATGQSSIFSQQLHATVLLGSLREYASTQFESFSNVLEGSVRNAETVAYRIAKYKGNPVGEPIKNYWIFNSMDVDIVEFIDTQLKYDNKYSYQVYAYNFVIGTEYVYKKLSISKTVTDDCIQLIDQETDKPVNQKISYKVDQNKITKGTTYIPVDKNPKYIAEFDVIAKPVYRIVEGLVYTKTFRMLDTPPLPPEVRIHPFIGLKDKIKISFQGSIGSETAMPVEIEESDQNLFSEIRTGRDLAPEAPIYYRTDDYPVIYEIYRTIKRPRFYSDFSGKMRVKIDLRKGKLLNSATSAAGAYNDKIIVNQKYYYTVRCYDVHGNMSNPSSIHEIELVEDKGAVYLVHNVIELDKTKPYMVSKPMKRLLYLVPNIAQSVINEEKSKLQELNSAKDLRNIISLGEAEESIWDKKFKMRLVSNKTGRKIDINLNFRVEHIRSAVENE